MADPIALLVDADQLPPDGLPALVKRLGKKGRVAERIAVRNWRSSKDQASWKEFATEHGFRLIQRDPVAVGKNATDIEVAIIAMDLLHDGHTRFCIVTGDTDFTPLVTRLRRAGCDVEWVEPKALGTKTRAPRSKKAAAPTSTTNKAAPAKRAAKTKSPAAKKQPVKRAAATAPATAKSAATATATATRTRTGRASGSISAQDQQKQQQFARILRRGIDAMVKDGRHEKGWVSVNRLGAFLSAEGHKREAFGFAKSRQLRLVLQDLGFPAEQIETGAYRTRLPGGK